MWTLDSFDDSRWAYVIRTRKYSDYEESDFQSDYGGSARMVWMYDQNITEIYCRLKLCHGLSTRKVLFLGFDCIQFTYSFLDTQLYRMMGADIRINQGCYQYPTGDVFTNSELEPLSCFESCFVSSFCLGNLPILNSCSYCIHSF